MDRLKRKLALRDIPVYEINHENEIRTAALARLYELGVDVDDKSLRTIRLTAENVDAAGYAQTSRDFVVVDALLVVEESIVFFVENQVSQYLANDQNQFHSALLIDERNIVDCIEVAFHKINNGSLFYGKQLSVIQSEMLAHLGIIIIIKAPSHA